MEEDDSGQVAFGFGFWRINVDVEGQISELLVGYGSGCRFRHR
jgi:hypothetical protein